MTFAIKDTARFIKSGHVAILFVLLVGFLFNGLFVARDRPSHDDIGGLVRGETRVRDRGRGREEVIGRALDIIPTDHIAVLKLIVLGAGVGRRSGWLLSGGRGRLLRGSGRSRGGDRGLVIIIIIVIVGVGGGGGFGGRRAGGGAIIRLASFAAFIVRAGDNRVGVDVDDIRGVRVALVNTRSIGGEQRRNLFRVHSTSALLSLGVIIPAIDTASERALSALSDTASAGGPLPVAVGEAVDNTTAAELLAPLGRIRTAILKLTEGLAQI